MIEIVLKIVSLFIENTNIVYHSESGIQTTITVYASYNSFNTISNFLVSTYLIVSRVCSKEASNARSFAGLGQVIIRTNPVNYFKAFLLRNSLMYETP